MVSTIEQTNYNIYLPFTDRNSGVDKQSSALSSVFPGINNLQQDVISLTGASKTIPADTLPENFVSLGWGTTNDLPDPILVPTLYVAEGTNMWLAANNPTIFDLGDDTPGSGTAWYNIYQDDRAVTVVAIDNSFNQTAHDSTNWVTLSGTSITHDINPAKHTRITVSGVRLLCSRSGYLRLVAGGINIFMNIWEGSSYRMTNLWTLFLPGQLSGSTNFKLQSIRVGSSQSNSINIIPNNYQMTIEQF